MHSIWSFCLLAKKGKRFVMHLFAMVKENELGKFLFEH